jgi:diacylglycerol kinase family enzyme
LHRDICVATALAHEMQPLHAQLMFDGRDASDEFLLLEILNIRRAGPGVELAPHASPSDGRFDVVSATAQQRPRLLQTLKGRLKDLEKVPSMTTRRARRVQLQVSEPCEMRIDDGTISVAAATAVEITIKPGALEFVLPG